MKTIIGMNASPGKNTRWCVVSIALALTLFLFLQGIVFARQPPPVPQGFDIYSERIVTPEHLDWLWQDYLLRGQKKAIAKLVTSLELGRYSGAIDKAKAVQAQRALTAEERQDAVQDAVFLAAMWSLHSNAKQHPEVAAELKRIERAIRKTRQDNLAHGFLLILLTQIAPDEYQMEEKQGRVTFATPSGEVEFVRQKAGKQ